VTPAHGKAMDTSSDGESKVIDDMQGWKLGRCSQEHGVLVRREPRADTTIKIGEVSEKIPKREMEAIG
jgi:D-serine deaminase-like pyridoxal phosphate-dependent protein